MRTLAYLLVFPALAYSQTAIIQVAPSSASRVPPVVPAPSGSCQGGTFNFSQTAYFNYTVSCVYPKGFTSMGGGQVNAPGGGACVNANICTADMGSQSGRAPLFSGQFSDAGSVWNVWVNAMSVSASQDAGGHYSCGIPSQTQGPVKQVTKPSCPSTPSPIIVDPTGEGFYLTDVPHGVQFRAESDGALTSMSWTDPAHHNAWLVKPNGDGSVTSLAANMFGNLSPQPESAHPNGYLALAYWASEEGCGKVTKLDAQSCSTVWGQLRLWHDANQDGIAQSGELQTLEGAGLTSISLEYHENDYTDQYGNQFRYQSKVKDAAGHEANRSYDVFLLVN